MDYVLKSEVMSFDGMSEAILRSRCAKRGIKSKPYPYNNQYSCFTHLEAKILKATDKEFYGIKEKMICGIVHHFKSHNDNTATEIAKALNISVHVVQTAVNKYLSSLNVFERYEVFPSRMNFDNFD